MTVAQLEAYSEQTYALVGFGDQSFTNGSPVRKPIESLEPMIGLL